MERLWLRKLGLAALALALAASLAAAGDGGGPTEPRCFGLVPTLLGGPEADVIRGGEGRDVIASGGGDDRIASTGAADRVCAGPGNDRVRSGGGFDRVEGGPGNDKVVGGNGVDRLRGGEGRDRVFGQLGSDRIDGGPGSGDHLVGDRGNDRIFGGGGDDFLDSGFGDDTLVGNGGTDHLVGGLGNDRLLGGPGDGDMLRADFGRDLTDGGAGSRDVASFAAASEPIGVRVDLIRGRARGDGRGDRLRGVEDVVGSAFGDLLRGDDGPNRIDGGGGDDRLFGGGPGAAPGDEAFGGSGSDACHGFETTDSCGPSQGSGNHETSIERTAGIGGSSISLRGSRSPDTIMLARHGGELLVIDRDGFASVRVSGCSLPRPTIAACGAIRGLDFVLLDTGAGADRLTIGATVPISLPLRVSGGPGRDRLVGGRGDDEIDGGGGADLLLGHGGSDALVAGEGPDLLSGGGGADLLVAAGACNGDRIRGGDGTDSASFARVVAGEVRARIGGWAVNLHRSRRQCRPVRIQGSVENLEGSPVDDTLIGDSRANNLLGRGGDDVLLGGAGRDRLDGGGGRDSLAGEADPDLLYARDGRPDRTIDCGAGAGLRQRATRDAADPPARGC